MSAPRVAAAAAFLLLIAGVAPARAATIPVTTLSDVVDAADGACALREAIAAVNAPPGTGDCVRADANANTVALGAGRHVLTRAGASEDANATGDLDVTVGTVSLTVAGAGVGSTTIDAAGLGDRILDVVGASPGVTLEKLTLTGGRAPAGPAGINGSSGAGGAGQPAGAIRSGAALTLTDVAVTDNRAGDGGAGSSGNNSGGTSAPGGTGGVGGAAGAIQSSAALTLTRVTFLFNFAGNGGAGGSGTTGSNGGSVGGVGGVAGAGGAVFATGGPVLVTGSRFDGNRAGTGGRGGNGGFGTTNNPSGAGGAGGAGGRAGGLQSSTSTTVSGSTFTANAAGSGGAGGTGSGAESFGFPGEGGAGGAGASGGAIVLQTNPGSFSNLTLIGNRAGAGGAGGGGGNGASGSSAGSGAPGGAGGAGGHGGGLRRQLAGQAYLTHATVTGNFAGPAGAGGAGGPGGFDSGGQAGSGSNGTSGTAGTGGGFQDASVNNEQFTHLSNSIVAGNSPTNCVGNFDIGAHNLAFGDASCPGVPIADPLLGALQDNGGAVPTMALLSGSPARDNVPAEGAGCTATDARGAARPSPAGGACDSGAFEVTAPACQAVGATGASGQPTPVQLACTHPVAPFTFSILTQPAHGTLSGLDPLTGRVTYTANAGYTGADAFTFRGTTADGSADATAALTVTAAPPPPGGGTGPIATLAAPTLSALKLSPTVFRARTPGSRVTFRLDRVASVKFTVSRQEKGRRSGKRCVAPTRRNRRAKACTRLVAVKGSFSRAAKAGANAVRFNGRIGTRKLRPARYVLRATPTADGKSGVARTARFRIRR